MAVGEGAWLLFEGTDVTPDEKVGRSTPAAAEEELAAVKRECLELGYGGFVVKRGAATFRPFSRTFLLEHKTASLWDRGSALHVAPAAAATGSSVLVRSGSASVRAAPATLAAVSGYFASLFRHSWADAEDCHSFAEFPGGERAFALAMAWLSREADTAVGDPWPLRDPADVCATIMAAAYLDSSQLLRAAVRSWNLAAERAREEQLQVAGAIVEASLQFQGDDQDLVVAELRALLQELPRHQLALVPEFLAAPAAGLAVLQARLAARETLVGHIRSVGGWVGSVITGSGHERAVASAADPDAPLSPTDFAARLFDQHEPYFLARHAALRELLRHVDAAVPIAPPLCFRIAAGALAAHAESRDEVFAGRNLAVDIFERSLGAVEYPAEAAADAACVAGLFGAGGRAPNERALGLDILARPLVPPAGAAVVLSKVLSSWAAGESGEGATDAADVILAGVTSDRQHLRALLLAILPRIADEAVPEMGNGESMRLGRSEWGSSFDFAVPELRAALARGIAAREASGSEMDDTARLLFRVLFQPTGGLPGVRFPLSLLAELRSHNPACASQAARCAVSRLRELASEDARRAWRAAEEAWPGLSWDLADQALLGDAVELVRDWLATASSATTASAPAGRAAKAEAKLAAARLLLRLPLERLQAPERLLGPPVPAHVLATLSLRCLERANSKIAALEAENEALKREFDRLTTEIRRST